MSRMRKFFVPVAAAVVGFAVAAPLISESATPTNDSSTVALSAGGTASITCTGASLSETLQSATSMSIVCNPGVTTPTSAPTSTSTTTSPTTTPTTTPSTTTTTTQPTTPPSGAHSSELGLYNNGTTASQLGVTVQVVSDYAYDPDWTTYAPSGAAAAQGKLLMLAVGALNPSAGNSNRNDPCRQRSAVRHHPSDVGDESGQLVSTVEREHHVGRNIQVHVDCHGRRLPISAWNGLQVRL